RLVLIGDGAIGILTALVAGTVTGDITGAVLFPYCRSISASSAFGLPTYRLAPPDRSPSGRLNPRPCMMFDDGIVSASLIGPSGRGSPGVGGGGGWVVGARTSAVFFADMSNSSGEVAKFCAFIGTVAPLAEGAPPP